MVKVLSRRDPHMARARCCGLSLLGRTVLMLGSKAKSFGHQTCDT